MCLSNASLPLTSSQNGMFAASLRSESCVVATHEPLSIIMTHNLQVIHTRKNSRSITRTAPYGDASSEQRVSDCFLLWLSFIHFLSFKSSQRTYNLWGHSTALTMALLPWWWYASCFWEFRKKHISTLPNLATCLDTSILRHYIHALHVKVVH